ncbi:hypothetical protein HELRODRAFT_115315 [Helobdella robusta]|uniref:PDZ domain-containing protein n=1 Tax=Helobdella robusta TaxID=6412 RepID=T1EG75_HELRO|nr:hypothetical protein HELRODRAFT_115315 [Helobdella robusta]ESN93826.1 hypothetical protein HELRODRAFT_115315 [Helobdella robusta]
MSKSSNRSHSRNQNGCIEVKSKLDAEFRRFTLTPSDTASFDDFYKLLESLHHLRNLSFSIWYTDHEGDLLPINNNDNYACALKTARRILRLTILKNGQSFDATLHKRGASGGLISSSSIASTLGLSGSRYRKPNPNQPQIGFPEDFRRVSAIIDIDIVPETCRRVKLMKSAGSDKPLGFYIRDGASIRITLDGLEKVPGIFISRMVLGGLAESTGLLAVNDEILEVNGIEVQGKTLDQVTDMMVANSSNLIITVKPVNQHNNISPRRHGHFNNVTTSPTHIQRTVVEEEENDDDVSGDEEDDGCGSSIPDNKQTSSKTNSLDGKCESVSVEGGLIEYEEFDSMLLNSPQHKNGSKHKFDQQQKPQQHRQQQNKLSTNGSNNNSKVTTKTLSNGVQVLEL